MTETSDHSGMEGGETPAIRRAREHGIDIGMLRANLRLTPAERLEKLFEMQRIAETLRRGMPAP